MVVPRLKAGIWPPVRLVRRSNLFKMDKELKDKTVGAVFWSTGQELGQKILQLVVTILLARALSPKEFGLVAMLSIFIAVCQALVDCGFSSALVREQKLTEDHRSSVFFVNVILGALLGGLIFFSAPLIASFYAQPELVSLARSLAVLPVISGFTAVQNALLIKTLNFKRQALINISAIVLSGFLGVAMALKGFGPWSLVAQQIAAAFCRSILLWVCSSWRPVLVFKLGAVRPLFKFGSRMTASVLLTTIFENLYPLIIGKMFSAVELGFYNRAYALESVASKTISAVTNRVAFPVFSQMQGDLKRLRAALLRSLTTAGLIQFPMMIGIAAVAKPLVIVLLTEKWLPAVPYLQILCVVGLLHPLHSLNLNVLMALGRSDLFFQLEVIKRILLIVNVIVTYRFGVLWMIGGLAVHSVGCYFINTFYTNRLLGLSLAAQSRFLIYPLLAALLMGLSVNALSISENWRVELSFKVFSGLFIYAALCGVLRIDAAAELAGIIRSRFGKVWRRPVLLEG